MTPADEQTEALEVKVRRLIKASKHRKDAGAELCAIGPEAIVLLCTFAQQEAKRRRPLRLLFRPLDSLGPAAGIILITVLPEGIEPSYRVLISVATTMFYLILPDFGEKAIASFRSRATKLLASLDDMRAVGPLLETITANAGDKTCCGILRQALSRVLPRLQASDAARLLPHHINALNAQLKPPPCNWYGIADTDYALVVLKTLEQVGDESSIPFVKKMVEKSKNPKVREAAEACLPFLQQRAELGKNTLLRASALETITAHLLLPASGGQEHDPALLLRSSCAEEK